MTAIILVRPQLGENIGACARVMANFGLTDLRIVAPRDGWPNPKAVDMAKHAGNIIHNATVVGDLADCLKDIHHLYATTLRPRDIDKSVISPRQLRAIDAKSAVMFGPERTGLSNQDIMLANTILTIDTNPEYGSLNLAQAVSIVTYELFQLPSQASNKQERDLASKQELDFLIKQLGTYLDQTNFFQVDEKKATMMVNIANMFARMQPSKQEVRTLHGIFSSLRT